MHSRTFALLIAIALSTVFSAACDRPSTQSGPGERGSANAPAPPPVTGASPSSTTPANTAPPTQAERKEGSNPVQGQVDPKESEQRRDFERKGDAKPSG